MPISPAFLVINPHHHGLQGSQRTLTTTEIPTYEQQNSMVGRETKLLEEQQDNTGKHLVTVTMPVEVVIYPVLYVSAEKPKFASDLE